MNRKTTTTSKTHLLRAAFFLTLLLLVIQVIPRVVGQRKTPEAPAVCPIPWQLVANMPLDLYGAAGASNGTFSYHAGGYSFTTGTTLNVFNRYDPVANTWTAMAPMPDTLTLMASAVYYPVTNKIYVFGGEDAVSGVNTNATRIYDIASNTWSAGANMPDVRSFMASGYNSANGKIYLVSGYNTGFVDSAQPTTWEYDPVANSFAVKAPFPHPAGGMVSGVINGHLYVAGGRDAANLVINLNWDYDIAANTWTAKANMPGSNNNVRGSGVALDNLWVFGGGNPFGPTASTKAAFARERVKGQLVPNTTNGAVRYDPATDTWSTAPNMNVQRAFTSGAAISAKLIAAGGYDGSFTVASAETLDACIPEPTPTPCDSGVIINGGFETGSFGSEWVIDGTNNPPLVNTTNPHSGTFAAAAGDFGPFPAPEPSGDSSFYQQFTVPASGGTLSFWHWDYTTDSITFDWQDAYITNSSGTILATIFHQCANDQIYVNQTVDMTPYAGQTVRIKFLVHQDGFGDDTGMYVDDVALLVPCATPTPTPTPTPTATPTPTPTPTPVQITLHARGYKVHGLQTVDLFWSGPTSGFIDIYRNGVLIVTVPNQGGFYTDHINRNGRGTYTYRVCVAGTGNCSNQVTVRFGSG
jgi:N-acetylneuraminic acid mutarotase